MRMTDTLGTFTVAPADYKNDGYLKKYVPVMEAIAAATGVPADRWELFVDSHQISTREAGKSSCEFFAARFTDMPTAVGAMMAMQKNLPNVNLELVVAPNGRLDRGDGIGYYDRDRSSQYKQGCTYVAEEGFSVALLVDAQNVKREMSAGMSFQNVSKPGAPRR